MPSPRTPAACWKRHCRAHWGLAMSDSILGDDPEFERAIAEDWRAQDVQAEFAGDLDRYRYYRWAERRGLIRRDGPFKFRSLDAVVEALTSSYRDTSEAQALRARVRAENNRVISRQPRTTDREQAAMRICRECAASGEPFTWKHLARALEQLGFEAPSSTVQRYLAKYRRGDFPH